MPDWIDSFVAATSTIRSPVIFRLWTAITTIAATLERRVWTQTDVRPLYPNLYTFLVGAPASGKTNSILEGRAVLGALATSITIGPDNPTKASFIDALEAAGKAGGPGLLNGGEFVFSSAMTVLCRELRVFLPKYDEAFFADLADIYDNPSRYSAPRRVSKSADIANPTLNILAGATPAVIGDFPDSAWGEGLMSRVVFVYGIPPIERRNLFLKRDDPDLDILKKSLARYLNLSGEFTWESDAITAFDYWYNDLGMDPVPTYSRLANYNSRRDTKIYKLSMISAVSSGHGLNVHLSDFERAKTWLLAAETKMPDVFKAVQMKSDWQILQDLHEFLYVEYNRLPGDKKIAIPKETVWKFLEVRATSDKITGLIRSAESTGRIRRGLNKDTWIPNSLDMAPPPE